MGYSVLQLIELHLRFGATLPGLAVSAVERSVGRFLSGHLLTIIAMGLFSTVVSLAA